MTLLPSMWWLSALLAVVLLLDAALSIKPVAFIGECLDSVHFPKEWWWVLIVAKCVAGTGLIAGIWIPGVAFAANVGVVVYFLCAAASHIRAGATRTLGWASCLMMLTISIVVLIVSTL